LQQLAPGDIHAEFARVAAELANTAAFTDAELAPLSAAVDAWTVRVAAFAMEQDAQLDLVEAADGLLV
jgi:hypothetical protein